MVGGGGRVTSGGLIGDTQMTLWNIWGQKPDFTVGNSDFTVSSSDFTVSVITSQVAFQSSYFIDKIS